MPTLGQSMSKSDRRKLTEQSIASNYEGGRFYAMLQYKAEDDVDDEQDFMKPIGFQGFANVALPDLGDDLVKPSAFSKETLDEFLTYGRQLFYMHDRYQQVGEITKARAIVKKNHGILGVPAGGLYVEGFVDSPIDPELGFIPDHPLAKVIHFARMQVRKGRLKLLSIGWRPIKYDWKVIADPRRDGEKRKFRVVEKLLLHEVSLVTAAMSPQSIIELQKAYTEMYGEDIATALCCSNMSDEDAYNVIPESVDNFSVDTIHRLITNSYKKATDGNKGSLYVVDKLPEQGKPDSKLKLVSLDGLEGKRNDTPRLKLTKMEGR